MQTPRVVFVTGKGGVGKTTVSAALGQRAAELGVRTLIIETANDGSLAQLFEHRKLSAAPQRMHAGIDAVRVDARELVEQYFSRLLSSHTFSALAAAAPGITEFLLLEKILAWIDPALGSRRRGYGLVIVDGPATGHALKLLRTPRNLATMVPGGPLGKVARRLLTLLADRERTQVVLVSLPDEMAVRETIEAQRVLEDDLVLHVTRPVINRVFPRHFTAAEAHALTQALAHNGAPAASLAPVIEAARFAIACRREAERHVAALRRALGSSPILLRQLFATHLSIADLAPFGRTLGRVVLGAPSGGRDDTAPPPTARTVATL